MTYDPFDPFNEVPMYQDFHLRFADQAEADSALFEVQADAEGGEVKVPKYAAIDVIGVIWKPTGNMLPAPDGSGDAVDEMAPLEGWHVNVRHTADAPELAAFQVFPQNPVRGWA